MKIIPRMLKATRTIMSHFLFPIATLILHTGFVGYQIEDCSNNEISYCRRRNIMKTDMFQPRLNLVSTVATSRVSRYIRRGVICNGESSNSGEYCELLCEI